MRELDEIVEAIYTKTYEYVYRTGKKPRVVVFIGYNYYRQIMSSLHGGVSAIESELYHNDTMLGHKVYTVPKLAAWEILVE